MKRIFLLSSLVLLLAASCNTVQPADNSQTQSNNSQDTGHQPIPLPPPLPLPQPQPQPQPQPNPAAVSITNLTPSLGRVSTAVTINGHGFTPTGNLIMFGDPGGMHHMDGTADNVIGSYKSADGTSLAFTVPVSGPSGILCSSTNHCIAISSIRRLPGTFKVSVSNSNGKSNVTVFTITP